ncbi:uncharacterized protein NESG_02052 [Nematocida ausubeli]|uniref:Uncharacterized protein n=1 Tax=Nematocida ausubeli (strain ATCC PRA-371 / ERTm2) TaxID=1913371 RepID=A0A086IZG3_NEMA1|nr:uncharacterized protein NESG_02052 [Nematocida ausubeli]KFG25281.1 hypothetical protein NESG_02052 [Nematocida ausubeli]
MFSIMKSNLSKRKNQLLESKEVATEDLKVHRIRQEEKKRAICRAKLYMLIGLAILCHVWDRILTVDGLRGVYIKAASFKKGKRKEKSNGVVSMVLRKEVSNIRLMHSKRFLSPEIQKDVTIIVNIDKSNKTTKHQYIQTRKCGLDRVNPILSYTGEMLNYKRAYFTTLLELFPSIYGYVSIVHEKKDSFHVFINSSEIKNHKHKILASLFLLAEGVAIPLTVNKSGNITDLALKKANLQEDHFKVNISASSKFIIRVINFFIKEQKKEKKYSSNIPNSKEFINSPSFLIQTYIKHSLKNKEEMNLFAQTVYGMLTECNLYRKKEMNMQVKVKRVLERYIIRPGKHSIEEDNTHIFSIIEAPLYNDYIEIGPDPIYLEPAMDVVPVGEDVDKSNGFTDYGETALLGLFCWASYYYEENRYKIGHIKSASKELKSFFQKHSGMYGAVSKELHDEWNQVVGGLANKNIQYMRPDRNQLVPGMINMMHVIKEITGVGKTEKINKFRDRLYEIAEGTDLFIVKDFYKSFKKNHYMSEDIFASVSEEFKDSSNRVRNTIIKYVKEIKPLHDEKLKSKISQEEKDKITKRMEEVVKIENDINIHILELAQLYLQHQKDLRNELANDIGKYMTKLIKKIAPSQSVSIYIDLNHKQTLKEGFSDIVGAMNIFYIQRDEQSKSDLYAHPYSYKYDISLNYNIEIEEIEYITSFEMSRQDKSLKKTVPSIEKIVKIDAKRIEEIIALEKSDSNPGTSMKPKFLNNELPKYIDSLLLEPKIYNQKYKRDLVLRILPCILDQSSDSLRPFCSY